jgi:hypothetical protein
MKASRERAGRGATISAATAEVTVAGIVDLNAASGVVPFRRRP